MDYVLLKKKDKFDYNTGLKQGGKKKQSDSMYYYPTRSDMFSQKMYEKNNVVQCLSSTILRNNLGTPPTFHQKDRKEAKVAAHHILPISVIQNHIKRLNDEDKDFFDSIENGIYLPITGDIREKIPYHNGNHPAYSGHVEMLWKDQQLPPHADNEDKQECFIKLIQQLRDEIAVLGQEGSAYDRKPLDDI